MRILKVPRVTVFYMHHHPKNVLPPVAARYISMMTCHPAVPKLKHVYKHREQGTLWWSVSPAKMVGHKKVIRSWCSRRLRHAFHDALKERGFDKQGKINILNDNGEVIGKKKGLQGTLDLRMNAELFEAKYTDIAEQAGLLVDHLRKLSLQQTQKMKATVEGFQSGGQRKRGKKP